MSTFYINPEISDSDCIGDSLATINSNFTNLDTAVEVISSGVVNSLTTIDIDNETSTIELSYTNKTLTANVKNNSISAAQIAPGTINSSKIISISATQLIGYSKGFSKFKENLGDRGFSSYYRTNTFISNDKRLYVAGYGGGESLGGGTGMLYADMGFHQSMVPVVAGETISNVYTSGCTNPSMYVLTNLGNLYSIGYNGYGQLGVGDTTSRVVWTKITGISDVAYFSCTSGGHNANHCLAVTTNGTLYSWGYNGHGQLGLGNTTNKSVPTLVPSFTLGGGQLAKCFAIADDYTTYSYSFVTDVNGQAYACGLNGSGQLGLGDVAARQVFNVVSSLQDTEYILSHSWNNNGSSYALYNNEIYATGFNAYGQLGQNNTININQFTKIPSLTNVKSFAIGGYSGGSVIALLTNNTVRTWGWNGNGQLGINNTVNRSTPQDPGLTNIKKVLAAGWTSVSFFALDYNGDLWTCGYNGYGQLGTGNLSQYQTFQKVIKDGNIKFVDFDVWGNDAVCGFTAVDQNGELYSCGYNSQHSTGVPFVNIANVTIPNRVTIQ